MFPIYSRDKNILAYHLETMTHYIMWYAFTILDVAEITSGCYLQLNMIVVVWRNQGRRR